MNKFVIYALLTLAIGRLSASEIKCENKRTDDYHLGRFNGCIMRYATVIDLPGSSISPRDEAIEGLSLYINAKIYFLPQKVAESFPNLLAYSAYRCSLTEVSKINFAYLGKLRVLLLDYNQIIKIGSNTFEDLSSLEYVNLSKKFISLI